MTSLISMSALLSRALVSLELSSCRLARQAGILLGQSLQSCRSLRRLVLADNNLRDGGLRAVVDALRSLRSSTTDGTAAGIDELDISRNGVTSAGFAALSAVSVRHINASENTIEGIGSFLLSNTTLESLDLSGNLLSEEGAHELFGTLFREQTALQVLDLRQCELSTTSIACLARALQASSFCSLRALHLDDVALGTEDQDVEQTRQQQSMQAVADVVTTGKFPFLHVLTGSEPGRELRCHAAAFQQTSQSVDATGGGDAARNDLPDKLLLLAAEAEPAVNVDHDPPRQPSTAAVTTDLAPPSGARDASVYARARVSSAAQQTHQLQHVDVEYIVSKTIECMNQNFEQRLGLFLLKMESQQQEKVRSAYQSIGLLALRRYL